MDIKVRDKTGFNEIDAEDISVEALAPAVKAQMAQQVDAISKADSQIGGVAAAKGNVATDPLDQAELIPGDTKGVNGEKAQEVFKSIYDLLVEMTQPLKGQQITQAQISEIISDISKKLTIMLGELRNTREARANIQARIDEKTEVKAIDVIKDVGGAAIGVVMGAFMGFMLGGVPGMVAGAASGLLIVALSDQIKIGDKPLLNWLLEVTKADGVIEDITGFDIGDKSVMSHLSTLGYTAVNGTFKGLAKVSDDSAIQSASDWLDSKQGRMIIEAAVTIGISAGIGIAAGVTVGIAAGMVYAGQSAARTTTQAGASTVSSGLLQSAKEATVAIGRAPWASLKTVIRALIMTLTTANSALENIRMQNKDKEGEEVKLTAIEAIIFAANNQDEAEAKKIAGYISAGITVVNFAGSLSVGGLSMSTGRLALIQRGLAYIAILSGLAQGASMMHSGFTQIDLARDLEQLAPLTEQEILKGAEIEVWRKVQDTAVAMTDDNVGAYSAQMTAVHSLLSGLIQVNAELGG